MLLSDIDYTICMVKYNRTQPRIHPNRRPCRMVKWQAATAKNHERPSPPEVLCCSRKTSENSKSSPLSAKRVTTLDAGFFVACCDVSNRMSTVRINRIQEGLALGKGGFSVPLRPATDAGF
jgi:hypothetical protein